MHLMGNLHVVHFEIFVLLSLNTLSSLTVKAIINNNYYSTMPRPLEPVERAAFFSECTLAGLRPCINQPG